MGNGRSTGPGDVADQLAARLANDPSDRQAYAALHQHYRSAGDLASLANLIAGFAAFTQDAAEGSRAYEEVARLLEQELFNEKRAEGYYRKALARDARNVAASEALQALLERDGRMRELTELIEAQLRALESGGGAPNDLAVLCYRLGELWGKHFERPDVALDYYRRAYELDSTLLRAVYEARLLCVQQADLRGAIALCETEAQGEPSAERKRLLLRELAGLYEDAQDIDGAVSALSRASALAPSDAEVLHLLATTLLRRAHAQADERARGEDLERVAEVLCDLSLALPAAEAKPFVLAALEHDPCSERALAWLERHVPTARHAAELAPLWVGFIARAEPGESVDARRLLLARAYLDAGQRDDAIYCLTPLAEAGSAEAAELLSQLSQANEPRRRSSRAPSVGRADGSERPAREEAQPGMEVVTLRADSDELDALRVRMQDAFSARDEDFSDDRTVSARSPFVDQADAREGGDPALDAPDPEARSGRRVDEHERETARPSRTSLAPLSQLPPRNDASELEEIDEIEAVDSFTPSDHDDLLALGRDMRSLLAQGRPDAALPFATRIVEIDPLDTEAFALVERHLRRERDFRGRAELLLRSGEREELPLASRKQRLREAVNLFETRVGDVDAALRAYRLLAQIDPDAEDNRRGMKRLLERGKRWDDLTLLLEAELENTTDPVSELALLKRLAELHRRERSDRAAAADVLRRIVARDSDDRAARQALLEDLLALERFPEAAELLRKRLNETESKAERIPLLRQLATLEHEQLRDDEAARRTYVKLTELVVDDAQALAKIEAIDEAAGAFDRLIETLEQRAKRAAPTQATELYVRMAKLAEVELGQIDHAASHLQKALALSPTSGTTLDALCHLYERAHAYDDLLALLRERVASEKSPKLRLELWKRMGRLQAEELHDDTGAEASFEEALQLGDDADALAFVERRVRERDDLERLASLLPRLAACEAEPGAKRDRLVEQANVLTTLNRRAEAAETLLRLLGEHDADDPEALELLEQSCKALDDYKPLAKALELLLSRATQATTRASVAERLAELYETQVPDEGRAVRALSDWASAAPSDPVPLRKLARLFERKRRHRELIAVLDALAQIEPVSNARHDALLAAAELALQKTKDEAGAFERVAQYCRDSTGPLRPEAIAIAQKTKRVEDLAELCEMTGRHAELFTLLRELSERETQPEPKAALLRKLAAALIEHAQDEAGALAAYTELLGLCDDYDALRFVQAWSLRNDDPERLAAALERLSRIEKDRSERLALAFEHGRVLLHRLRRTERAIAVLEEALTIDAGFVPVLDELSQACQSAERWDKLAVVLERKLGLEDDGDERAQLLDRLFTLYEGPLADDKRAAHALRRRIEQDPSAIEPFRRLRALHTRTGHHRELVAVLDLLAQREEENEARLEATLAAAQLAHEKLGDPASAFARLAPLVPLYDAQADAAIFALARATGQIPALCDLLEDAGRHEDLVRLLLEDAPLAGSPAARAMLFRRAARTLYHTLQDAERAEPAYESLLALEEDIEALRFLQARALAAGDVERQAQLVLRLAALEEDPREARDLLYEHAHLLNFGLGRPERALPVLARIVFELDPDFDPALDELISAAQRADDKAMLARALEHAFTRENDVEARIEILVRLHALYDAPASRDDAACVRTLEAWASLAPYEIEPLRALRPHLERRGEPAPLIACLDRLAELSGAQAERTEAQLAAARIALGSLRDVNDAFARVSVLSREGEADADTLLRTLALEHDKLREVLDFYEQESRYDELVSLLREHAESETDPDAKADLYLRCAQLLTKNVGDEVAATEAFREVLALREDPDALAYLLGVAERLDDVDEIEDLQRRLALLVPDRVQKRDLLLARALLLTDRLDRTAEAIEVLRQIVTTLDPSCVPAIDELIASSEALGNLPALAQGLERKLVLAKDRAERAAIATRLADLYENELAAPDMAAEALRRTCEAAPEDVAAYRRLRPHLVRQKSADELLHVLDALARLEDTKASRHEALLTAARAAHEQLGDAQGAFARLAPWVEAGDVEAEHLLAAVCRSAGLGTQLAGVYIRRAQAVASKDDARAAWREVVRIHEQWQGDDVEAFEASLRLLAVDTTHLEVLDEVDRLGTKVQAFGRLAQVYARLVKDAPHDKLRVSLLLRAADLMERQARDPAAALDRLLLACKLAPSDESILARAEELARRLSNHSDLLWLEEQRATRAGDQDAKVLALLEAARTADIGVGDREQAMAYVRQALELAADDEALLRKVEELAAELDAARPGLGKDDARRTLVRDLLEIGNDKPEPERTTIVLHAARYVREQLRDEGASFDLLRAATSSPPYSVPLLDALEELASRMKRLDALNAHLARGEGRATERADKSELLRRRARLLHEQLGRHDQAAQAYERLLELAPDDERTMSQLVTCLKQAGRYRELLHTFERRLERVDDPDHKLNTMRAIAALWEVELKNRASAIEVWNEVRNLAPEDEEARHAIERLQSA